MLCLDARYNNTVPMNIDYFWCVPSDYPKWPMQ
jgi:hypothetical protein